MIEELQPFTRAREYQRRIAMEYIKQVIELRRQVFELTKENEELKKKARGT